MLRLTGAGASPGIVEGAAYLVVDLEPDLPSFEDAGKAFDDASDVASSQLSSLAESATESGLEEAAEILTAQSMMADDPMLATEVHDRLANGATLETALNEAIELVVTALEASGSDYLAARAPDIREIGRRIRFALAGVSPRDLASLDRPSIIVAEALTAADTASMNPDLVLGFVTEGGGPTGHVAVIARSLEIPAAVGVAGATTSISDADTVILDGSTGEVVISPDEAAMTEFRETHRAQETRRNAASSAMGATVAFGDRRMAIAANVGGLEDVASAVEQQSDGVGLFRTEFLFLDTDQPPGEEEQVEVYTKAVSSFKHPVVVRTFDIGGDKPARYIDIPHEENPFLGVRGMRLYPHYESIAMTQARALLRASVEGDLWVMAPMVSTVGDIEIIDDLFDRARTDLDADGLSYGEIELGIMVEVPAVALNAAALANKVDFFSIGTNDLTQYTLAVDRTSGPLAGYTDAADPAVLQLCAMTASAANSAGISASVCGEAGSDPLLAPLFAAMGMDKLSVGAPAVNLIKHILMSVDPQIAEKTLRECLAAGSAGEVRRIAADAFN